MHVVEQGLSMKYTGDGDSAEKFAVGTLTHFFFK